MKYTPVCLPKSKLSHSVSLRWSDSPLSYTDFTASYLLSRHFANFAQAPYLATDFKFHDRVRKQRIPLVLPVTSRPSTQTLPPELIFSPFFLKKRTHSTLMLLCEQSVEVSFTPCSSAYRGQFGSKLQERLKTFWGRTLPPPLIPGWWKLGETWNSLSGFTLRLSDVCRGNVAPLQPNFSRCGFTY